MASEIEMFATKMTLLRACVCTVLGDTEFLFFVSLFSLVQVGPCWETIYLSKNKHTVFLLL